VWKGVKIGDTKLTLDSEADDDSSVLRI